MIERQNATIKTETSRFRPDDIVIAVVGVTGAGKSTFISYYTDEEVEIGTTLESCKSSASNWRGQ